MSLCETHRYSASLENQQQPSRTAHSLNTHGDKSGKAESHRELKTYHLRSYRKRRGGQSGSSWAAAVNGEQVDVSLVVVDVMMNFSTC